MGPPGGLVPLAQLDQLPHPDDVLVGVEEQTETGRSIPASPPPLLVVTLYGLRDTGVDHKSHIGLINAHAEGDGGADHLDLVLEPVVLGLAPLVLVEAGVVSLGFDSSFPQILGEVITVLFRQTVDDARLVFKLLLYPFTIYLFTPKDSWAFISKKNRRMMSKSECFYEFKSNKTSMVEDL